jgi:hypothetical protein
MRTALEGPERSHIVQKCQPQADEKLKMNSAVPFRPENYVSCHQFCGFANWTDI